MDDFRPSSDMMLWAHDILMKYLAEANSLLVPCWNEHEGFEGYGYLESCLTFAIVRELKPKTVFEISPACGMSTYPLALAVKQNGTGRIYSFEINPEYVRQQRRNLGRWELNEIVETIEGNALETVQHILEKVVFVDVLFMDSAHEEEMAQWYMKNLWPQTKKWMHVHDFYYLPQAGEIEYIKKFLQNNPSIKWLSSKHLYAPNLTQNEVHGEANTSIWIKKPPFPPIVKKWEAAGAMFE